VNEIQELNPVYNKWYMDDGGIIGNVELLKKVWELQVSRPRPRSTSEPLQMRVVLARSKVREALPHQAGGSVR
jgi:hypothetical protein